MVEIKNKITGNILLAIDAANLRGADLRRADLSWADLREANLSGANLRRANLRRANLSEANLREADLRGAKIGEATLSRVIQVGPIGSRGDYLVAWFTDEGLLLSTGCQTQIAKEAFEARLAETHTDNKHAREYLAALAFLAAVEKNHD